MYAEAISVPNRSPTIRDSQRTNALYNAALLRGRRGMIWSGLTGCSRALLSLDEVFDGCTVHARSSGGTRTVDIAQICGSENRVGDFDCDFNPLQDHTRDRWLSIASARQRGRYLPPVALIQVGDRYFVRDGHHRISVARALGQQAIEACVEVWQVDRPVSGSDRLRRRPAAAGRRHAGSIRRIGDRLWSAVAEAVPGLLGSTGAATSWAAA